MSADYQHKYYHAGVDVMYSDTIPELLGNPAAEDEWLNEAVAESNFINIDSYNQFAKPSCVFLIGRIGTGKTAILNRFKYSINCGKNDDYDFAELIDTQKHISEMSRTIRLSHLSNLSYAELENVARGHWEKIINVVAMKAAYVRHHSSASRDLQSIEKYLSDQKLLSTDFAKGSVLERIADNFGKVDDTLAAGISTVFGLLSNPADYDKALHEFNINFKNWRLVILIDSIERYEYNDTITLAVINALVNLCTDYSRRNRNISLKMAAPSELIPNLTSINLEKIINKIVYIRWSQADLKAFIAVRLYRYKNKIEGHIDQQMAMEYFENYYDEWCETRSGFKFQTFAYCMTYTQNKPRHALSIFNTWLYFEEKYPSEDRMSLIKTAITQNELVRVKGAFNIYSSIHSEMFEMFKRTFNMRKYCFSQAEFDEWLSACSSIRAPLDAHDLKRFFISSGLVGSMIELHTIHKGNKQFENDREIRIKEVLFEYQYKERLPFNSETKFCLHPMCFRVLSTEVDENTFVYPKPLELDGEFVPWKGSYEYR